MGKASDKNANKEIEKAYDLLHASPTRSTSTVKLIEEQIKNMIIDLEDAVLANDSTTIITISGELILLIEERNRKIKISN